MAWTLGGASPLRTRAVMHEHDRESRVRVLLYPCAKGAGTRSDADTALRGLETPPVEIGVFVCVGRECGSRRSSMLAHRAHAGSAALLVAWPL